MSSTCLYNMVIFGLLAAEVEPVVWGTPANFNGFRVLAALLHGTPVVGVSQTAALNRGRHLCSAGRPSRWALAHILVEFILLHLAWVVDDAKYILDTRVSLCVCLSLAAFPHYSTDPGVTLGNGRRCPVVVHCWADLQSMHGFRCYDNIAPNAKW